VANVIAVECCDASVDEWLWESGGVFGQIFNLDIWTGETKILQMPWKFIKNKDDLESQIRGLQIQFSDQPLLAWLLPHDSTTRLEPFLCLYCSIIHKAFAIFSRKWSRQIIQEICAHDGAPTLILPHIMCSFFSLYCQFIYAARHLQQ